MTASPVGGSSRAQPMQTASASQPTSRPTLPPNSDPRDVRAMRDALTAAKGSVERQTGGKQTAGKAAAGDKAVGEKSLGQSGKKQLADAAGGDRSSEGAAASADEHGATERLKSRKEGADGLAGWAGQGAGVAVVPGVVDVAAPHVDAGAFAQMMADLWTRENGRGSKEVRVRYGNRSWPATGAVLVRNAAGTLDVALQVGDGGQAYGTALPQLEGAMRDAGVSLGVLTIERDS